MINARLQSTMGALSEWCKRHSLAYDLVCDESNIQGIKLFTKDTPKLRGLLQHLQPILAANKVHLEYKKVRSGTVFAFSLDAISESQFETILQAIGEEPLPRSFLDKLDDAFMLPSINEEPPGHRSGAAQTIEDAKQQIDGLVDEYGEPIAIDLRNRILESGRRLAEDQYKSPDSAMGRTSKNRQSVVDQDAKPGKPGKTKVTDAPIKVVSRKPRLEERIANALGIEPPATGRRFRAVLDETLQGMATSDQPQPQQPAQQPEGITGMATSSGAQPDALYQKFARALQVLGQSMGIGPLQDKLKGQGIKWKTSDDGMSIILYVLNAATRAPQPIARISSQTLDNPGDFETQLSSMLDFAKGQAPGTEKQKQEEMQATQKAIGQIAKSVAPDKDQVSQAMGGGQMGQQPMQSVQPMQPPQQPQRPVQPQQIAR